MTALIAASDGRLRTVVQPLGDRARFRPAVCSSYDRQAQSREEASELLDSNGT
jgi:hypothetical protein